MHGQGDPLQGADAVPHGGVAVAQEGEPVVGRGGAGRPRDGTRSPALPPALPPARAAGRAHHTDAVDAPGVGGAGQPAVLEVDLDRTGCARGDAPGLVADDLAHQGQRLGAAGHRGQERQLVAGGGAGQAPVAAVAGDGVPGPDVAQHPVEAGAGESLPQLAGRLVVRAGDHRPHPLGLRAGGRAAQLRRPSEDGLQDEDLGDAGGVVRPGVVEPAAQTACGVVQGDGDRAVAALERRRDVLGQPGGEGRFAGRGAECGRPVRLGGPGGARCSEYGSEQGPGAEAGATARDHDAQFHEPGRRDALRSGPSGAHHPLPGLVTTAPPPYRRINVSTGSGRIPRPVSTAPGPPPAYGQGPWSAPGPVRRPYGPGAGWGVSARRSPSPGRRRRRRRAGPAGGPPRTSARGPGPRPARARRGRVRARSRRGPGGASGR